MTKKKPISYKDITESTSPPPSPVEAVERIAASIHQSKGQMLDDQKFLKNLVKKCVENPDSFVRERKGEASAAEKKIERHSL